MPKLVEGKGVWKVLVETASKRCRDLGCCEAEVSTERKNEKARAFYKSYGFEEDSVLLEYDLDSLKRITSSSTRRHTTARHPKR